MKLPLAALLILLPCSVLAQTEIVPAKARITNKVIFVVDVSGSMAGDKFSKALQSFKAIAGQPVDQMEFALIAFDDVTYTWEGMKEKGMAKGWSSLPSQLAIDAAEKWLKAKVRNSSTDGCNALKQAFRCKRKNVTVVIVTDGIFNEWDDKRVRKIMKLRGKKTVMALAIDDAAHGRSTLKIIGTQGKGGTYRIDPPKKDKKK